MDNEIFDMKLNLEVALLKLSNYQLLNIKEWKELNGDRATLNMYEKDLNHTKALIDQVQDIKHDTM